MRGSDPPTLSPLKVKKPKKRNPRQSNDWAFFLDFSFVFLLPLLPSFFLNMALKVLKKKKKTCFTNYAQARTNIQYELFMKSKGCSLFHLPNSNEVSSVQPLFFYSPNTYFLQIFLKSGLFVSFKYYYILFLERKGLNSL
jgi:hypothetical protein